ncbi:MAG: hypothetical protein H6708_24920 [Kofleriaceae bacterium]|nr:hypothetical protein [Myxococcales bacterium]MCB9563653.1 hypothetical protein [Kofleriaceae bacterium]
MTARTARRPTEIAAEPERPRTGLGGWLKGALTDNLGLKFLSLVLALTVFLLVNTDEDREIRARVHVAYSLPADKVLVSERVDEVKVTIRGPWRRIKRFDEREIDRISIDLTRAQGGEIAITPDMIDLPRGLEIVSIEPKVIRVAFEDLAVARVEVHPEWGGRPLHGYQVAENLVKVEPATVVVRGAAGTIRALQSVRTQEVRVDGRSSHFDTSVPVVPPDGVEVDGDPMIKVSVAIQEELVTRKTPPAPVRVELPPGVDASKVTWVAEPGEVQVELTGGLLAVERMVEPGIRPVVTLTPDMIARGQKVELPVRLEGAPQGVGVTVSPPTVVVVPRK